MTTVKSIQETKVATKASTNYNVDGKIVLNKKALLQPNQGYRTKSSNV